MMNKLLKRIIKEQGLFLNMLIVGFVLGTIFGYKHPLGIMGILIAVLGYPSWAFLRVTLRLVMVSARIIDRKTDQTDAKETKADINYKKAVTSALGSFLTDLRNSPLSAASFVLSMGVTFIYITLSLQTYVEFWALYTAVVIGCICGVIGMMAGLIAFHKTSKGIAMVGVIISAMITILFNLRYFEFLFKK